MAGHTRGPWRAVMTSDGWFIVDRDDDLSHNVLYGLPAAELEANARLAAAAPELLAALNELLHASPASGWEQKNARDRAQAAIAKAEGR